MITRVPGPIVEGLAFGPRRFISDPQVIDIRMSQDIAEIFAAASVVYATDVIRRGWTPAQVEAFQARQSIVRQ